MRSASRKRDRSWALIRVHSPHSRSCLNSVNSWQMRQTCLLIVFRFRKLRLTVATRSLLSKTFALSPIPERPRYQSRCRRAYGRKSVSYKCNGLEPRQCGETRGPTRRTTARFHSGIGLSQGERSVKRKAYCEGPPRPCCARGSPITGSLPIVITSLSPSWTASGRRSTFSKHEAVACCSRRGLDLLRHPGRAWLREIKWPFESAIFDSEACAGDGHDATASVETWRLCFCSWV